MLISDDTGSIAAWFQSAAGTPLLFRIPQSAAMGGWSASIVNGVVQGGAAVMGVVGSWFGRAHGTGENHATEVLVYGTHGTIATIETHHESSMTKKEQADLAELQAKIEEFMVMQAEVENGLSQNVIKVANNWEVEQHAY
jgi:hypothetical protein